MQWGTPEYARLLALCDVLLGRSGRWDDALGALVFDPPLLPDEQATFAALERMARSHITGLSLAEFTALDADLAALRAFRQQSQADFMALTATQRDRAMFDVVNAQTNVLRALLRD